MRNFCSNAPIFDGFGYDAYLPVFYHFYAKFIQTPAQIKGDLNCKQLLPNIRLYFIPAQVWISLTIKHKSYLKWEQNIGIATVLITTH